MKLFFTFLLVVGVIYLLGAGLPQAIRLRATNLYLGNVLGLAVLGASAFAAAIIAAIWEKKGTREKE